MTAYRSEKDFYGVLERWFLDEMRCKATAREHRFDGLGLLTGDVVGWSTEDRKQPAQYVCETKLYPYPVGAAGYGAVGQALALRRSAEIVYVGGVASELVAEHRTWHHASKTTTMQALLRHCGATNPETFDEYLEAARQVFKHFYSGLGLGFLVVRENEHGEQTVHELVTPTTKRQRA